MARSVVVKPVRARRQYRNRKSHNYLQNWTNLLVVCHNHCRARSNFRFTTRVRLRHVRRSAHLGHVLAAFHLWSCHRCVGDHARQQRRSSPADHQEDDGYSGETSHGCESRPTVSRTQVIPITVLSDGSLATPNLQIQLRLPKDGSHNALRPRTRAETECCSPGECAGEDRPQNPPVLCIRSGS